MSARPNDRADKAGISIPTVVGTMLLLVIFIGFLAYKNLAPSGPVPVRTATSDWLEKIARESGGDYNKLSPADKAKLDQIPFGGREWLKRKYESLH